MEDNYSLLLPFLDESENFVHGFECGQVWQMLSENKEVSDHLIHSKNIGQFELMAKVFKKEIDVVDVGEGWSNISFTDSPYHLRLVPRYLEDL